MVFFVTSMCSTLPPPPPRTPPGQKQWYYLPYTCILVILLSVWQVEDLTIFAITVEGWIQWILQERVSGTPTQDWFSCSTFYRSTVLDTRSILGMHRFFIVFHLLRSKMRKLNSFWQVSSVLDYFRPIPRGSFRHICQYPKYSPNTPRYLMVFFAWRNKKAVRYPPWFNFKTYNYLFKLKSLNKRKPFNCLMF